MQTSRRLAMLAAGAFLISAPVFAPVFAQSAFAQNTDPGVSGPVNATITLDAKGAAVGVGYTWGDGVLQYAGKSYPFSVSGVTIADVGYSEVKGTGRVYNLKKLSDFSGVYAASTGEATVGDGIGGKVLVNGNGVQIRVDEVTKGARLQGSADGIKLTLK